MKNILLEETLPGSYGYYDQCTYYRKDVTVEKTSDGYTIDDEITVPSLGKYLMEKGESPAFSKVILGESVVITVEEQGQQMTFTGNTFTLATPLPTYGSLTGYYIEVELEEEKIGLFATGTTTNPEILDQAIFRWFSVEEVPYERKEVAVLGTSRQQKDVYNTWGEGYYTINDNFVPFVPRAKAIIEHTGVKRNVRINSQYGPLLEGEIVSSVKWEDSNGHISEVSGNLIMAYYDSQNVWYFGNVVGEGEVMLVQDQVYYLTPFPETLYTDIKPGVTYYKDEKIVAYNQSVKPLAFEIAEDETRTLTWEEAGMTDEIYQTYWDMYRSGTSCGKDYGLTINGEYPPVRALYGDFAENLRFKLPVDGKTTVTIFEHNRTVDLSYERKA